MKVNLNELICELYMHKFVIFLDDLILNAFRLYLFNFLPGSWKHLFATSALRVTVENQALRVCD